MLLLSITDARPGGTQIRWYIVVTWVFCVAALGVVMGIPMKRSMINREKLKFPSGTAAAVLLQSLYSEGTEALAKGRALFASAAFGALVPLLTNLNVVKTTGSDGHTDRHAMAPSQSAIFDWLPGISAMHRDPKTGVLSVHAYPLSAWNVVLDHSVVLLAAGAIVGLRVTLSMLAGGLLLIAAIGPLAMRWEWSPHGTLVAALTRPGAAWKEIGIWFGAPLMVAHGLITFALQFKTIGRALADVGRRPRAGDDGPADRVEVPLTWFVVGTAGSGAAVVALAWLAFDIPLHYGALAVFLTFFLALVACRATG
jgi:uncharacterized oligopeptide transporter (OPT) family protein